MKEATHEKEWLPAQITYYVKNANGYMILNVKRKKLWSSMNNIMKHLIVIF
jgi:hypothetical protein